MKKAIKKIAALAMALTIAGAGTSASGAFSANVLTAEAATVSANYVSGNTMKRADFVNIIYTKSHSPKTIYPSVFKDVPDNSRYARPINWAYHNGIVSGYPGKTFGVNDPITYEQVAQILFNYTLYAGYDMSYTVDAAKDYKRSQWAQYNNHCVDWAVTHKILTFDICHSHDATKPATPAVCHEMIRRYERYIIHKI